MPRRSIFINIDPNVPHPEKRTGFAEPDLLGWVREHRGELLAAMLTLIRAWVVAGEPVVPIRSDNYDDWSACVGGILKVAGIEGELWHEDTNRARIGADDEEWREFLAALHEIYGDKQWTARELIEQMENDAKLYERLTDAAPDDMKLSAKSLGKWLRNREGRFAGEFRVHGTTDSHTGTTLWRIEIGKQ
jgi:hypothetical protein